MRSPPSRCPGGATAPPSGQPRLTQLLCLGVRLRRARALAHARQNHSKRALDSRIARVNGVEGRRVTFRQEQNLTAVAGDDLEKSLVLVDCARQIRRRREVQLAPLGCDDRVVHKRVTRVLHQHGGELTVF